MRACAIAVLLILISAPALMARPSAMDRTANGRQDPAHAGPVARGCLAAARIDGIVTGATADYIEDALDHAQKQCAALLVIMDTPGGNLDATRHIVQGFLQAQVPVIVYVSPAGARAGSAGMFIAMAAHVTAMAPGATIGAAHPVLATGGDPEEAGEHIGRKIENDTAALARAIAQTRDRNIDWAERAVRESISATADEAAELDVIDAVYASRTRLLQAIDGRTIDVAGEPVELRVAGAALDEIEQDPGQKLRSFLANPTLSYILLLLGFLLVVIELSTPGLGIFGGAGALAVVLAFIGMDAVPVNVGGVLLLIAAAGLFIAELFVTSYGFLALAGVISMAVGATLLIDWTEPGFFADASIDLSWTVALPFAVVVAVAVTLLATRLARLRRRPPVTGAAGLTGTRGVAVTDIDASSGRARVRGELWRARSDAPIAAGQPVKIRTVEGLTLHVAAVSSTESSSTPLEQGETHS